MPGGKSTFNKEWLLMPEYSGWLLEGGDKARAKCAMCKSSFDIGNMGNIESVLLKYVG